MTALRRAALAVVLSLAVIATARADIHALVVGIDDYAYVPGLAGAVNDARDLAAVLERRGAEVTLVLDREATRARILGAFSAMAQRARAGDTIVFSYAGHGVQLPEALPGDEADGMDETFILYGFEMRGPGYGERIRDNDIAEMLSQVPEDVGVLVIADSCHSGTMTRAVDPRGALGRTRWVDVGAPTQPDTLPVPEARTRALEAGDFPNVVFANAARDDQQTPEVRIDGDFRGALSWSIARALEGAADGGDGATSLDDLQHFVVEQVRSLSGARQTPGVGFVRDQPAPGLQALAALFGQAASVLSVAEGPDVAPPPSLFVRTEGLSVDRALLGDLVFAETEETARLLWDRGHDELVDRATADVIAEARTERDVRDAVQKWRLVEGLARWIPKRPLEFRLDPDDRRYEVGEKLWIVVTRPNPEYDYLTIVNLASTGEVQFIYPAPGHVQAGRDRFDPVHGDARLGPSQVTEPVGADHVIAIASTERLDALHRALDALHGRRDPSGLRALLMQHAGDPTRARIGLLPIFTQGKSS